MYVDKDQRIGVMSIGFLLSGADEAVVWRGPKKNGKIHDRNKMIFLERSKSIDMFQKQIVINT